MKSPYIPGSSPLLDACEPPISEDMALTEAAALTSAAISLKRIADALWGIEGTSGLLELLNPLDVRNNY